MPVRTVLRMGHPFLNKIADPVITFDIPELNELVIDMFDTMAAYNGAGLAAPQIGVGLRVVIFGAKTNPRYPQMEPVPVTILINPVIDPVEEVMEEGWEGCLSVPGLRGLVPRYSHIRYCGYDQTGNPIAREVEGFHARVVQHECDHLDGILFPRRIKDFSHFGFEEELFMDLDKEDRSVD
ncbi:peptide deformylase [Candidatus Nitrosoglobus terrae]|uniref:Peptide deformylase n=1 Tax=Candidatus Nitrosoglobus terrae TaxID=1630141 RepID=A0A1Q2SL37_9GAMM|nr:peptide deformylase [Candidatus Nitrosoglobus terrae]BAW79829.1 peptide deformylase [Candidatus Nitrosoglobus terrae]